MASPRAGQRMVRSFRFPFIILTSQAHIPSAQFHQLNDCQRLLEPLAAAAQNTRLIFNCENSRPMLLLSTKLWQMASIQSLSWLERMVAVWPEVVAIFSHFSFLKASYPFTLSQLFLCLSISLSWPRYCEKLWWRLHEMGH